MSSEKEKRVKERKCRKQYKRHHAILFITSKFVFLFKLILRENWKIKKEDKN